MKRSIAYAFMLAACCCTTAAQGQLVAFPGAEGAGKYTTGGRGTATAPTTVFEVTNLSDDGQPGSLRYALTASATYRTVVFRVSGTIHLSSKLNIRANTTLAGQTAPGDGICVADYPVVISGDNVIVRYMRFRMGDRNQKKVDANGNPVDGSGGDDALGALGASNIMIDHCSVSWSSDEALTIYRGDNLTIQWSMISEPLNYSYHFETGDTDYEQHGYGGIWGAKRGSMHHNLIAHCRNRNPRFAGTSTYSPNTVGVENVDFRNNVIYNWGINTVYGGDGGNYNVVNNYYKWGPNTSSGVKYRICNPSKSTTNPFGKWYVDGNYVDGSPTVTADNWQGVVPDSGVANIPLVKATTAFDHGYPLPAESATDAYEAVLKAAGCILPNRDTLDQRIVSDVRNRSGRIIDVQGGYPHGTPYDQTVNAWPALRSTAPLADDDHDGMPNSWEVSNGLDPANAADRNTVHASGFTMLEVYLNSITNTNPRLEVIAGLAAFSQVPGTPSAAQTFSVSAASLSGAITVTAPTFFELSLDGTTWYSSSNPLVLNPVNGSLASTTISVRLNAASPGSYSGSIRLTSTGASEVVVAVSGRTSSPNAGVGSFPEMDGGFEKQAVGDKTTATAHTSTTAWEGSAAFKIVGTNARTGDKFMKWNQASGSNKYLMTPVLTANPLQPNTQYVVQFWYRIPEPLAANTTSLQITGWATLAGAFGGSTNSRVSGALSLNNTSPYGPEWRLFTSTLTTDNATLTNSYAGFRITNPQPPYFDIDDYVVYAGSAADATAPDAVSAPLATPNAAGNYITVRWTPPSTGVDGGGFVVVRSTSATTPALNPNGVYAVGNRVGTDGEVIYIGADPSLSDVAVAPGTTYSYYIFTADKAYNYSAAATVSASLTAAPPAITTTGTLAAFTQTVGTPSATQTYSVSGANLATDITVTPPAGFELSVDDGATWATNTAPLVLYQSDGTVAPTVVTVRLHAPAAGTYAGTITHSSGAAAADLSVSGTASAPGEPASPVITTTGTLSAFSHTVGTPSATQTYTVSGTDLSGSLTVTPPAAYEVSNNGTTWYTASSPLVLAPANGAVAATTISVRLNAAAAGSFAGNITHASPGAATKNVAVSGTATAPVVVTPPPVAYDVVVAKDGSGNYTTVQAAIDAAPTGRTTPYVIYIKNGKYKEKITVPSNKPFLHFVGESVANVLLTYDDYSGKAMPGGGTYGTSNSASVTVNAADCFFANITFENTTGDAPQALAINVGSDRVVLVNCRFLGGQDTVLAYNSGRSYFKNCYIDGTVDFIFGNGKTVFDSTVVYPKTRQDGLSGSYITAANTPQGQAYGFVFRDCVIPSNFGTTAYVLGRPWQNDGTTNPPAYNKTVFINTTMGNNIIQPAGWSTWAAATNTSVIYYGEYRSRKFDSSLVNVSQRVPWSYQLTAAEAASYTNAAIFGSWDPLAVSSLVSNTPARAIAVSNFKAKKGSSTAPSQISWNISWPMTGITYELFRSSDRVSFSKINEQVAINDTAVNFSYAEAIPPPGATYYYYVRASKSGLAAHLTDTVQVSSTPTITVTGTLGSFKQGVGAPSAVQAYTVSGVNLTSVVTITPPAGYEVSANNGATWYSSTTPLVLAQSGGVLATTTISVRLNAATAGSYTGNIVHTSTGAAAVSLAVNGTVQTDPLPPPAAVLQHWPMSFNNSDSAAVRSPGVLASAPTLNRFTLSNGTQVATIPAYSPVLGQAFGASTNGDGTWMTSVGGPGGNLNRSNYEQFTVKGAAGYTVKVDSFVLTTAMYGSASNLKLAVVYSKSGFASDSADVSGGTGPAGALLSTANGGFTTPVIPAQQNNGPTNTYAFALADAAGVVLAEGQTLTVRVYYSCGSTSAGKYALVKDVQVKGAATLPAALATTGTLSAFSQTLGAPSTVQSYTVSGSGLSGAVTITPPAAYQVSADGGATWFGNTTPLVLPATGGRLATTTISVRLNATATGTFSGTISHSTPGVPTQTVSVTGTVVATSVTVNGTLNEFLQVGTAPSGVQTYTVGATNLGGALTITPPAGYEVSADGTAWFSATSPLVLPPGNGTLATTTVSVRLKATAKGTYTGSITHAVGGNNKASVPVSGKAIVPALTVSAALQPFSQTVGTPSAVQSFTVEGTDLLGKITITPPAGFQVSVDGKVWYTAATPLALAPADRAVAPTAVRVRQNAAETGLYGGSIALATASVTSTAVDVSGTAFPMFSISPNPTNGPLTIYHPKESGTVQFTLYSAFGWKVATLQSTAGSNVTTLNVSGLPGGVYYLDYLQNGVRTQLPFVKQ